MTTDTKYNCISTVFAMYQLLISCAALLVTNYSLVTVTVTSAR